MAEVAKQPVHLILDHDEAAYLLSLTGQVLMADDKAREINSGIYDALSEAMYGVVLEDAPRPPDGLRFA